MLLENVVLLPHPSYGAEISEGNVKILFPLEKGPFLSVIIS
jgi:hypothetical protein